MCVIIVKFKGADFPSKQVVAACMQANPEGFAAAWNENGVLKVFKTLSAPEMMQTYEHIRHLDKDATGLVLHARIMTHGPVKLENCHCWTDSAKTLAFAHNGVLHSIEPRDKGITDSETFFRDFFLPVYEACDKSVAWRIAEMVAKSNNSRFAFIDSTGTINVYGAFSKECEEGHHGMVYFSNMAWKSRMSMQWDFDKKKKAQKTRGSVIVERGEDGRVKEVYVKDLLRKDTPVAAPMTSTRDELPFWRPTGGLFD